MDDLSYRTVLNTCPLKKRKRTLSSTEKIPDSPELKLDLEDCARDLKKVKLWIRNLAEEFAERILEGIHLTPTDSPKFGNCDGCGAVGEIFPVDLE